MPGHEKVNWPIKEKENDYISSSPRFKFCWKWKCIFIYKCHKNCLFIAHLVMAQAKKVLPVTEKLKETAFLRVSTETQQWLALSILTAKTCDLSISIKQTLLRPNVRYLCTDQVWDRHCCTVIQSTYEFVIFSTCFYSFHNILYSTFDFEIHIVRYLQCYFRVFASLLFVNNNISNPDIHGARPKHTLVINDSEDLVCLKIFLLSLSHCSHSL